MEYLRAEDSEELNNCLLHFFEPSNMAKLLEVITNADNDGRELRSILKDNRNQISLKERVIEKIKRIME